MQVDEMAGSGTRVRKRGQRWAVAAFVVVTALYGAGFALSQLAGERFSLARMVVLALFAFPVVGVLVAYRRPGNRIAWLCLGVGLAWGLEQFFWGIALYGIANPQTVSNPELWAAIGDSFWVPGIFIIPTFILMLFPDGNLPSRRWRWLQWLTGFTLSVVFVVTLLQPAQTGYGRPSIANPLHPAGDVGDVIFFMFDSGLIFGLLMACVVASVVSVLVRHRRSSGIERKQLKWLTTAGAVAACVFLPSIFLEEVYGETLPLAAGLTFVLIPVAIGMAVTRYRLYEIDRIVSRTVSYVLVVGSLAVVYLGGFFLVSEVLPFEDDLGVAAATLSVAALFNPVRRRIRSAVDRRFNRSRFNTERVMDDFSGSLQGSVDSDALVEGWVSVVSETMQPSAVAVWIRPT